MAAELTVTALDPTTLALVGELDTHTASQLGERLDSVADGTVLVLDLAEISFISSAGLSVLLNAQRRLDATGGSMTLRSPTASVIRLMKLSGLSDTFDVS